MVGEGLPHRPLAMDEADDPGQVAHALDQRALARHAEREGIDQHDRQQSRRRFTAQDRAPDAGGDLR